MEIPQQVGSADCGAFAIAIATALASGSDPTEIIFQSVRYPSKLKWPFCIYSEIDS